MSSPERWCARAGRNRSGRWNSRWNESSIRPQRESKQGVGTHAALLALSVKWVSSLVVRENQIAYSPQARLPIELRQLNGKLLSKGKSSLGKRRESPEATNTMLPPLCGFPRSGFAFIMANEACLTARKALRTRSTGNSCVVLPHETYERALIRTLRMNSSEVMSCRGVADATPAWSKVHQPSEHRVLARISRWQKIRRGAPHPPMPVDKRKKWRSRPQRPLAGSWPGESQQDSSDLVARMSP